VYSAAGGGGLQGTLELRERFSNPGRTGVDKLLRTEEYHLARKIHDLNLKAVWMRYREELAGRN
jgi:hypothetical protein